MGVAAADDVGILQQASLAVGVRVAREGRHSHRTHGAETYLPELPHRGRRLFGRPLPLLRQELGEGEVTKQPDLAQEEEDHADHVAPMRHRASGKDLNRLKERLRSRRRSSCRYPRAALGRRRGFRRGPRAMRPSSYQ